jgi:VIT1/CCC1 family predicted Fe2+/Mn2+ transporter
MKDEEWENLYVFAKNLADANKSFEEIEKQLSKKTDDSILIAEMLTQIKKVRHAVKTKNGVTKIGFGALFLISGFLITCINFHSNQSFTIVMYSFTSIGLILMFWGLYDIIG